MQPFSRTRRRIAFVILVLGLSTAFAPLFSASPPVAGRVHWSAWNVAWQVYAQKLSFADVFFNNAVLALIVAYALMLCALPVIALRRPPQKALAAIAVIGSIAGYEPFYWGHDRFAKVLFPSVGMRGAIQYEYGIYVLAAVMPALLYVLLSKSIDS